MSRVNITELQLADVIFSREPTAQSMLIQVGSMSPFSHVLIYSGNNKIIQATGSGVTEDPLS
jgi:cell wall-associated NlpC family hydrolase